jgi:hypothetical protein
MTSIHIDLAEPTTEAQLDKCPDHPNAEAEGGFGLAGGGFGPYMVCTVCCRIFGKINLPDSEDE